MKFFRLLFGCILLIFLVRCSEDGGPGTLTIISFENQTGETKSFEFYSSIILDTVMFSISQDSSILLCAFEIPPGKVGGLLNSFPNAYDSVVMTGSNDTVTYLLRSCPEAGNMLCEENYLVIIDQIDNRDNRFVEKRFIIQE